MAESTFSYPVTVMTVIKSVSYHLLQMLLQSLEGNILIDTIINNNIAAKPVNTLRQRHRPDVPGALIE